MAPTTSPGLRAWSDFSDWPIAFLVTTTTHARGISENLGSAAYSYYFVVEALAPVLEQFGTWRLVDHPESRLAFAAAKAEAEGFRPIHLAINPLQDVYLCPDLPNVVFPFWEFPNLPNRDFGTDTRQNWVRVCRPVSLVLTACRFTAEAFRRSGVGAPVAVVPTPLAPSAFELPNWDPSHTWTLTCRHEVLGTEPDEGKAPAAIARDGTREVGPLLNEGPHTPLRRAWLVARSGFRQVAPWLGPRNVERLMVIRRAVTRVRRQGPRALVFTVLRDGYRRHVRRWLSDEAVAKVTAAKVRALALVGREPHAVPDPPLPSAPLTLSGGLVYLTVFNIGDPRKNYLDILSAFLIAFRDRPDATLVIKLVTNRVREHHEAGLLRANYRALGLSHRCRVVVITEFLTEEQMDALMRVTTYYVNASHAEGACLPLMRALACGRPAIAPDHTAMADYMDNTVGFVLASHPEPIHWPHDPERRLETYRYRPVWSDLRDAFLTSAKAAEHDPGRYRAMSATARARLSRYASRAVATEALRDALALLPDSPSGTLGWAS